MLLISNARISKRLLKDIHAIKNGTYVDEGMMVEDHGDKKNEKKGDNQTDKQSDSCDLVEKGFISQTPNTRNERLKQVLKSPLISEEQKN